LGDRKDIWPVKTDPKTFSSGTGGGGGPKVELADEGSPGKTAVK